MNNLKKITLKIMPVVFFALLILFWYEANYWESVAGFIGGTAERSLAWQSIISAYLRALVKMVMLIGVYGVLWTALNREKGQVINKAVSYEDVKKHVQEGGIASASSLQRKFEIGYARAAGLLDELEEDGIVGPSNGAKPRKIINN
jgi:DNA segregation ATPase FtsK/SpoIIIE-like protein